MHLSYVYFFFPYLLFLQWAFPRFLCYMGWRLCCPFVQKWRYWGSFGFAQYNGPTFVVYYFRSLKRFDRVFLISHLSNHACAHKRGRRTEGSLASYLFFCTHTEKEQQRSDRAQASTFGGGEVRTGREVRMKSPITIIIIFVYFLFLFRSLCVGTRPPPPQPRW